MAAWTKPGVEDHRHLICKLRKKPPTPPRPQLHRDRLGRGYVRASRTRSKAHSRLIKSFGELMQLAPQLTRRNGGVFFF
jgi:hypothetical protein